MDRSDLELVLAIRQHGSLSSAARALHVTPPVITKRLAALEGQLEARCNKLEGIAAIST